MRIRNLLILLVLMMPIAGFATQNNGGNYQPVQYHVVGEFQSNGAGTCATDDPTYTHPFESGRIDCQPQEVKKTRCPTFYQSRTRCKWNNNLPYPFPGFYGYPGNNNRM